MFKGPKISEFMVLCPNTIEFDKSVTVALEMMEKLEIRHLPVVIGIKSKVIGVVSERDLKVARVLEETLGMEVTVERICKTPVYSVSPDTPLAEVLNNMVHNSLGSALISENDQIVGIFTTSDACYWLSELITGNLRDKIASP